MQGNADDFIQISDGHPIRTTPRWRLLILRRKRRSIETLKCSPEMRPSLRKSYVHGRITALEASFTLHSLSTSFATSESTDVQDFVYALRGIAVECVANERLLVPDYSKAPHEVLADVKGSLEHLKFPDVSGSVERGTR